MDWQRVAGPSGAGRASRLNIVSPIPAGTTSQPTDQESLSCMLYPLKFKPRFVEKIWGGRKLETVLGKTLPLAGTNSAKAGNCTISRPAWSTSPPTGSARGGQRAAGRADAARTGRGIRQGPARRCRRSTGRHGQFPILIKFLDAREDLSVQVHPDQAYADANPGAHLKTEAWYVMQHDPGSRSSTKGCRSPAQQATIRRVAIADGGVEQH